jgi:F-type H+-transporting ATPase subunit delta
MAERKVDTKVARRYARVTFEAALEQNALEPVHQDLTKLVEGFAQVPQLMIFLDNPALSLADKTAVVQEVVNNKVHPIVSRLMGLLVDHSRMASFELMVKFFESAYNEHENRAHVELITASHLSGDAIQRISQTLQSKLGFREVTIKPVVDPSLLGGAVIRMEDQIIDGSFSGRLRALRSQLTKA